MSVAASLAMPIPLYMPTDVGRARVALPIAVSTNLHRLQASHWIALPPRTRFHPILRSASASRGEVATNNNYWDADHDSLSDLQPLWIGIAQRVPIDICVGIDPTREPDGI